MTKEGYVSKIHNGYTYVVTECESACGPNCAECSSHCKSNLRETLALNPVGAKVGDRVEMSVEDSKIVFLSFVVYMLPLIILFVTWVLCDYLWRNTLVNLVAIIALLGVWVFFIRKFNKKGIINKIERIL